MMPPRGFHHAVLPSGFAVVAAPRPPDATGFTTEHFQLISNSSPTWSDTAAHHHSCSDELFVVLSGVVVFDVDGQEREVSAGEVCAFPAGLVHRLLRVVAPVHFLVVRAPAAQDKTCLP